MAIDLNDGDTGVDTLEAARGAAGSEPAAKGVDGHGKDLDLGGDLEGAYCPPPHVTAGHVYSNAYRKSMKLNGGDKDKAKVDAKKASRIFQDHGLVSPLLCGKFAAQPRTKKVTPPGPPAEPCREAGQSGQESGERDGDEPE